MVLVNIPLHPYSILEISRRILLCAIGSRIRSRICSGLYKLKTEVISKYEYDVGINVVLYVLHS